MKQLLFIDTNIYLRFFDSNQAEYKRLLKTLGSLGNKIFITRQIQYEIERNKLDVFRNSFDLYLKYAKNYNNITLPEHLDNLKDAEITTWNRERKSIIKALENSNQKLNEIYKKKMTLISKSEDEVSKTLKLLFIKAQEPTIEELTKAQVRKERGNPPGKPNDPLGDQINWEQLLNNLSGVGELYIISNDYDFLTTVENTSFLNPVLFEELKSTREKLKINCFHSLSNALLTLTKTSFDKIQDLPSEEILAEINIKEEKDFKNKNNKTYYEGYDPRTEELQRLTYMFKHALLSKENFISGLQKLDFSEGEINGFLHSRI